MNDIHPTPEQLAAFDAGDLPAPDRATVEHHVADCESCCRTLEGLPEDALAALVRCSAGTDATAGGELATLAEDTAGTGAIPAQLRDHPRYEVLQEIGRGGMGVVYRARQKSLDREVALKVIHPALVGRPDAAEQFRREAHAQAHLHHPNIVAVYDADQAGELHFIVMQDVGGENLADRVKQSGPLPVDEACAYVEQAALALQYLHEQGLVHRDIKPSNLLLARPGPELASPGRQPGESARVMIADLGLARLLREQMQASSSSAPPVLGTPDYLAPEQARDPDGTDIRADIYSLGCTLYFLLAGQPPFPAGTTLRKLVQHQETPPRPITEVRPDVPLALAVLLVRMLAKAPADRPATPREVARELAALRGAPPLPPPRAWPRWLVPGLTAGVVLAACWLFAWQGWCGSRAPEVGPEPRPEPPVATVQKKPATPPSPAAPPTFLIDEQLLARQRAAADQAIGWLRQNNRWGPEGRVAKEAAREVGSWLHKVDGFQVDVGAGLLKSARPTILAVRRGAFFRFEPTPEQVRALKLRVNLRVLHPYRKVAERWRAEPRVELSDLQIDRASALRPGEKITGRVHYRLTGAWGNTPHLRLVYYPGRLRTTKMLYLRPPPTASQGTISFGFSPFNEAHVRDGRPVVLFVDVASREEEETVIDSNTLAELVQPPPAGPASR
jgi:hypothetical protein